MFNIKLCAFVFMFVATTARSNSQNELGDFLWNLYELAIQGRQTNNPYQYPYSYKYPGKYPEYYENYLLNKYTQYPGSKYPVYDKNSPHLNKLSNNQGYPPHQHYGFRPGSNAFQNTKKSVMEVLYSIASNDDLQCVPKLICEVTSGTMYGRQSGSNSPSIINMESLIGFLSTLNGVQTSPLLHFGKAALLGFSSKGNTGSCNYAYPDCPSDPDKVVKYLNNHNGGFFRFFNGHTLPQNYAQNYNYQIPYQKSIVEDRIQNNVGDNLESKFRYQNGIVFPRDDDEVIPHNFRTQKGLKFPNSFISTNELYQNSYTYPHNSLKFPNPDEDIYEESHSVHNLPSHNLYLPNTKPSPMIFPDRTGTGDLRLDPEELQDYRPVFYQDEDVKIDTNHHVAQYIRNGRGFTFPQK